ncbi:developmental regulatory protein [Ophiostoma piceae UAMH 11346]|uniref:Developmental regulatory protein n=1 Tax=Ophiostoma piceae (strain UAMH 11346) TaxID=1262450 RepID=S3CTT6_OPHP1|nr:developmental regulatory protein [Ophiostoma piceae UAMH 11346]
MDSLPGQLPNEDYYSQYGILDEGHGHMDGMTVFDPMGIDDLDGLDGLDDLNSLDSHFLMDGHMMPDKPASSPTPYTAGLPTPISVSATPEATTAAVSAAPPVPPMPAGFPPSFFENENGEQPGQNGQCQNGEQTSQGNNGKNGLDQNGSLGAQQTHAVHNATLPFQQHPQHPTHEQQPQQQLPAHLLQNLPPAFANNPHAQALLQQNPLLYYQLVQMQQASAGQDGSHGQPPSSHLPQDHRDMAAGRCPNGNVPDSTRPQHSPHSSGSPSLHPNSTNGASSTGYTNTVSPNTATTATASSSTAATAMPTATPDDLRLQDLSIVPATAPAHRSSTTGPSPLTSSASTATITGPQPTSSSTTSRPLPRAAGPPGPPQTVYLPSNPPPHSHSSQSQAQSQSQSHPPPLHPSHHYMNHPPPPHIPSRSASSPIHNNSHPHPHSVPPVPTLPPQHHHHLQQQIPLPPPSHSSSAHPSSSHHTLSPKKQRAPSASAASASTSASTSPKKPSRFENIYATIRKATTMRRSRAAFINEAPAPTVAPMALMRDTSINNNNNNMSANTNPKAHAHFRSHHPGDLDLDLSLAGNFPMTPPLTGNGSSLSSTSSTFSSSSACSSLASSFDAQHQNHNQLHSHPLMMQPTAIHYGANQCGNPEDEMTPADLASFGMSGLVVDDPFVDSSAFFGGGHAVKSNPSDNAVSSACWPASTTITTTPNMKAMSMSSLDDNDSTPVSSATTAAINIPGTRTMVSPTSCLADATATMSGTSLIAAATMHAATQGQQDPMVKRDGNAMDTDEDWWQQSVVESAVGDAHGLPYYGDNNTMLMHNMQAMDVNGHVPVTAPDGSFYPMPDMATQGLMIHMPPNGDFQHQQHQPNQYYFPNVINSVPMMTANSAPHYAMQPQPEMEFRRDRASNTPRRPKPRAPSAGARHLQPGGSSPRKRLGVSSRAPSMEDLSSAYICSNGPGNAAAMTAPNTPRSHANGSRRSVSMQSLSRTSPTPNNSAMPAMPPMPTTPSHNHNGVRKRRSASSMRRVSSGQSCGSMSGAPRTPIRRSSAEPLRPHSAAGRSPSKNLGFVNFTADDHSTIMNGVARSGSSKTKERRDRELKEKTRKLMEAVVQAGGDVHSLEVQGLREIGIQI